MTNLFMLFYCLSFFGTSNFIPLYLQEGNDMSIYKSGLILLSIAVGWMFGSTPAGKWIIRYGYKSLFIIGSFITTASGLALYLFITDLSYLGLFLILTIQGVSFGLLFAVGTIASQEFAESHIKGMSTSLQMFLKNIGTLNRSHHHGTHHQSGCKHRYWNEKRVSLCPMFELNYDCTQLCHSC